MTTKYAGATWKPLSSNQTQPRMSRHDIICLHTMVGNLHSTYNLFHSSGYGGTESHFGVGGIWGPDRAAGLDGKVWQFQDLDHTADANYLANGYIISVETADNAPSQAKDLAPWTDAQLDAIVDLVVWLCRKYSIPAVMVPDSKPGRRGIAVHRQGIEHSRGVGRVKGWLVKGGVRWSTSLGKECPGDARIRQTETVIVPRVKAILEGKLIVDTSDEKKVKAAVVDALTDPDVAKTLMKNLMAADVLPAPATEPDPKNPTWRGSSYFRVIVEKLDGILSALTPKV